MARLKRADSQLIYDAAARWVDEGLRTDGSLFTPGRTIWSIDNARTLGDRLTVEKAADYDSFEQAFEVQLQGAPPDIYQLAGEALYVYYLVDRATTGKTKRKRIQRVLGWSQVPVQIPADLDPPLDAGLVNPGAAYVIARPYVLKYLMEVIQAWKTLASSERDTALSDPWVFRAFLFGVGKIRLAQNMREALLHLVHPEVFEPIVSGQGGDKTRLVERFKEFVTDPNADVDRQLVEVRKGLEPQHGIEFEFYKGDLRELWKPTAKQGSISRPPQGEVVQKVPAAVSQLFLDMAGALKRRGQLILYGPPGTGKTYEAGRFSVWWLAQKLGRKDSANLLVDDALFNRVEQELTTARRVWWVVANPKEWSWDQLAGQGTVNFRFGRLERNYPLIQPGDLVVGYSTSPQAQIAALARVQSGLHAVGGEEKFTLEHVAAVSNGPTFEELSRDPVLVASEPMRMSCRGTLFALTEEEAEYLLGLLAERDPTTEVHGKAGDRIRSLTRLTFHPTYGYEDFVEGYRPVESGNSQLMLRRMPGVFKQVCRAAQAHEDRTYLVLIDEINRGNLPKIFGELITVLERDKRGLTVILPQSGEVFAVPPNVYLLGTMNTADRSIRLLDAALRRRFAFIELMPRPDLLADKRIDELELGKFLRELNLRISRRVGREKQIGHSYFMHVASPEEFHDRFVQEVLPLLQEYASEDYRLLQEFLGADLVDAETKELSISNPDALVASLQRAYQPTESLPIQVEE